MAKEKKCPPAGVPEYMLTYGDMMTLLLCFFVLLVSMSTITEVKFHAAIGSLRAHLGFLPAQIKVMAILKNTKTAIKIKRESLVEGIKGEEVKVMSVKQGTKIVLGGKMLFNPGEARLRDAALPVLAKLGKIIIGYRNLIEIRGHTASAQLRMGANKHFSDHWQLSSERARAVANNLIMRGGVDPRRVRVTGCAQYEPMATNLFAEGQSVNRRVEVIVSDDFIIDKAVEKKKIGKKGLKL